MRTVKQKPKCIAWSRLVGVLLLLSLLPCRGQTGSVGVVASGYLTVEGRADDGSLDLRNSSTNQYRATMSLDGRWGFEIRPIHEPGDAIFMSFDGVDTFFVRYREALRDPNGNIVDVQPLDGRLFPGYISSGNYPFATFDGQKRAHILWLFLGSGSCIEEKRKEGNGNLGLPLPWIEARMDLRAFGYDWVGELNSLPPFCPDKMRFVRRQGLDLPEPEEFLRTELNLGIPQPGKQYQRQNEARAVRRTQKWRDQLRERKAHREGFVIGLLEASGFASTNGMSIPKRSLLQMFDLKPDGKTLVRDYRSTVTNLVSFIGENPFRPSLNQDSFVEVMDSRFRFRGESVRKNHLYYILGPSSVGGKVSGSDGKRVAWLTTNNVTLNKKLEQSVAAQSLEGSRSDGFGGMLSLVGFFIGVCVLAATSILLFAKGRLNILVGVILTGSCVVDVFAGATQGLVAEGYLKHYEFSWRENRGDGATIPRFSGTNLFRLSLGKDRRWALELRPLHVTGDSVYMTFDGEDTFFAHYRESHTESFSDDELQQFSERVRQQIPESVRKGNSRKLYTAHVSKGFYPFVDPRDPAEMAAFSVWLLSGSGYYLRDGDSATVPIGVSRDSLRGFGYRHEFKLHSSPPYVPLELRLVRSPGLDLSNDAEMERAEINQPSQDETIAAWKEELRERSRITEGTVRDSFEASDFIELQGMALPREFSFRQFNAWKDLGYMPPCRSLHRGIVTNVTSKSLEADLFRPPIRGTLVVSDSRFKSRNRTTALNHLNYTLTSPTNWPSVTNSNLAGLSSALLGDRRITGRYMTPFYRQLRMVEKGVLILSVFVLPWFLYRRSVRKREYDSFRD